MLQLKCLDIKAADKKCLMESNYLERTKHEWITVGFVHSGILTEEENAREKQTSCFVTAV